MHLVLLLYALFGSVFTIAKTGLMYTQPLFFLGSRMVFAASLILGYLYFFNRKDFFIKKAHLLLILFVGAFNIYLTNILEFIGLKHLTAFKTCFIYSLTPFLSALLSYIAFSEKLSLKKWIGLIIGFVGFIPILFQQSEAEQGTLNLFYISWAELCVIGAASSTVLGWIGFKKLVKEKGYSHLAINGWTMLIGGALALAHSTISEDWNPLPVTSYLPYIECTLLLTLISNILAYNLYGYCLKKYTVTFMSFAGFTTPLFAALFGWLYLGEQTTTAFYLSFFIVFIGLLLFYQEELDEGITQTA